MAQEMILDQVQRDQIQASLKVSCIGLRLSFALRTRVAARRLLVRDHFLSVECRRVSRRTRSSYRDSGHIRRLDQVTQGGCCRRDRRSCWFVRFGRCVRSFVRSFEVLVTSLSLPNHSHVRPPAAALFLRPVVGADQRG